MGRMKDFNLWLEETGRAEWCELTDTMVFNCDTNDPALWEEYLSASKDNGVVADDGEDLDSCDESSGMGVIIDDGDDDADDYWFDANGGLTSEAWDYLAYSDRNGDFV